MLSKLLNNNNLRRMDEEEFFNITTKDSIFLYSSYRLLSQYNFKRKKQNTLL